jgi:hypothetical protein
VRLVDELDLAAAVAGDPQEPRGECAEGLVQSLSTCRQLVVADPLFRQAGLNEA